jgi:hypothetical protein
VNILLSKTSTLLLVKKLAKVPGLPFLSSRITAKTIFLGRKNTLNTLNEPVEKVRMET